MLLDRLHGTAEQAARQTVQRVTRVAESTVNRHFLAVDGMLAGLPAVLGQLARDGRVDRGLGQPHAAGAELPEFQLPRPGAAAAGWPALGRGAGRLPRPARRRSRRERPGGGSDAWGRRCSAARSRNALTGEWSLMFLRAMELPGVGPLVAVAEVPVPLIATMLAPIGEVPGMRISVERADGRVLAVLPHDETADGPAAGAGRRPLPADGSAVAIARPLPRRPGAGRGAADPLPRHLRGRQLRRSGRLRRLGAGPPPPADGLRQPRRLLLPPWRWR